MTRRIKGLLVASLVINLIFFALAGVFVQRRGGLSYIATTLSRLIDSKTEDPASYSPVNSLRYLERTSIFRESMVEPEMVFIGDSLVERAEWSEFFPGQTVINRGIGGDTTEGVLNRLVSIGTTGSGKTEVFLYIGINDLMVGIPDDVIIENYRRIIRLVKNSLNNRIFIQSLLPLNNGLCRRFRSQYPQIENSAIQTFNEKLRGLAFDMGVNFIDLYAGFVNRADQLPEDFTFDGLHLNGKGYMNWVKIIKKTVKFD